MLCSTVRTPAVLQLGPTDPLIDPLRRAPRAVDVAAVTPPADHHPRPTRPASVSATGLYGTSCRSSGRPSRPPASSPLDTKRLVASRTGGPALVRPPPNFRTLLQPPKLAGQKVGIKRYSPFWRAIRSSMTPSSASISLCPIWVTTKCSGWPRAIGPGSTITPLFSVVVPRAAPHSGRCTRLEGQGLAIHKRSWLRPRWPMPAMPPASTSRAGQLGNCS